MTRSAHIAGAGIAGLATAVALSAQGWTIRVFERSPDLRTTGGGIGITPNGMLALDAIGVGDAVRARAVTQHEGGVRAPGGRWIARSGLRFIEESGTASRSVRCHVSTWSRRWPTRCRPGLSTMEPVWNRSPLATRRPVR
ncbi:FAD-dependent oxidoreductase [Kibdelosporangium aridum]|uniref:FAD-dependent oxidoreductase n=1 Tax=Kibdelosporangium aridum TaxID=2030 RepID=UPI0035E4E5CE